MLTFFAVLGSWLTVYLGIPRMIPVLQRLKAGQTIRDEGPESHRAKTGTPTMGGLGIIAGVTIGSVIFAIYLIFFSGSGDICKSLSVLGILWVLFVGHGVLGFIDDYIKVHLKRNLGLTARGKLTGQIILSMALVVASLYVGRGTEIYLPFINGGYSFDLGIYGFSIYIAIVLIGTSNAVNLTDGLDGLAAGTAVFSTLSLAAIAASYGNLNDPNFVFSLLIAAACVGFLSYNRHPAKIFMGDTGSLALGGGIAAIAVLLKVEILLVLIGGVFVAEALSVIIQVIYFKATKGKRFFRMSPLHHHFELGGWSEKRVVYTFWFAAFILGILGYLLGT